jgi:hypothetical protein
LKPRPKTQEEASLDEDEEERQLGLDDLIDDPDLLAEMKQWEAASDEDFWKFEQGLLDNTDDEE